MTVTAQETKLSFSVPVNSLLDVATKVGSIVPAKGDKPIVSNMKFSVHNGALEVAGTDLRAFLYHKVPDATVTGEGVGLITGSRLLEILREFKGGDATLTFEPKGNCRFKSKDDVLKVLGDDPRDFPTINRFDSEIGLQIKGSDLVEMIHKAEFAANPEQNRLAIHGVCFELKGNRFRLVATDTKRIAYAQRTVPLPVNEQGSPAIGDFSAVAPLSSLRLLTRCISKDIAEEFVTVGVSGAYIFFRMKNGTAYALTVNGKFPPYEEGFKVALGKHIDCGVDQFLALLRKIILVDPAGASFEVANGKMTLRSQAPTVGAGDVSMPINYTGETVKIGFCPKFIQDAMDAMVEDRCRFIFDGPRKVAIFKELVANDTGEVVSDDYACAIMPIVISTEAAKLSD